MEGELTSIKFHGFVCEEEMNRVVTKEGYKMN